MSEWKEYKLGEKKIMDMDTNLLKEIITYKENQNRFCLGNNGKKVLKRDLTKYMTIESFKKCIDYNHTNGKGTIQFVEPNKWDDEFEQRFYIANYNNISKDKKTHPRLFSCCFSTVKKSYAAWRVFENKKLGNDGLCVKIVIDRKKFSKELCKYNKRAYKIYEGIVDYGLSDYDILHLHEKSNRYHQLFFGGNFEVNNYLSLLLIKRNAFDYEKEFRYFMIPPTPIRGNKIYPEIDWGKVIKDVEVDIHYPDSDFNLLKDFCETEFGRSFRIHKIDLNSMPGGKITIQK